MSLCLKYILPPFLWRPLPVRDSIRQSLYDRSEGDCTMNEKTPGELAFEEYLTGEGILFEHEPPLSFTSNLIDYVVDHPTHGKIYFEVKDINRPPPPGSLSQFDPYLPIRNHIGEGQRKLSDFADELCALVLFAPPGSFVKLDGATRHARCNVWQFGVHNSFRPSSRFRRSFKD